MITISPRKSVLMRDFSELIIVQGMWQLQMSECGSWPVVPEMGKKTVASQWLPRLWKFEEKNSLFLNLSIPKGYILKASYGSLIVFPNIFILKWNICIFKVNFQFQFFTFSVRHIKRRWWKGKWWNWLCFSLASVMYRFKTWGCRF